ncbi:MAG: Elongation factor 4 [Desulfotomaculum sp. 46_296]|nr:MAG: Elongation factor 4 [Desulfotomaculum sp. 46_296]HAU31389.1 elongation factor 4 [Desulfotomaculum sp.]
MKNGQELIRNFCIIAHIDHGKSTLADRLLEYTGALSKREMTDQVLDQMDLERERGITIKAQAVRLNYRARNGHVYQLNLIDTPGHVDFNYEVSRSLAACEGALLVVDAVQGIEAQTLANAYLAIENNLVLIPVINKIDLPNADPAGVKKELEDILCLDVSGAVLVSAKLGTGIEEVLEQIILHIPPPCGSESSPARALIFDSHYDSYKGVIAYVRVVDGCFRNGMGISVMSSGRDFEINEVGFFRPAMTPVDELKTGEVGFIAASIKNLKDTRVGDTITAKGDTTSEPLPGYRKATPMVYCGLYPVEAGDYGNLQNALQKLQLNDASLIFEPETSIALGFGFRCGFLGLLHMEIVQERIEREYGLNLIITAPSVVYRVTNAHREEFYIENPAKLPSAGSLEKTEEPFVSAVIMMPKEYIGSVMELCQERRGVFLNMEYLGENRVMITYEIPLSEIIYDFFDHLKSRTRGYASLDYELAGYREGRLVRLDIMVNGEPVDALTCIVHADKAYQRGRQLVEKLRSLMPRQLFDVPIQAAVGSKVIARETVKARRKDVLSKCYGGDITRKRKLLEKQKEGKRRMKQVGNVEIPQEAFMAVLSTTKKE